MATHALRFCAFSTLSITLPFMTHEISTNVVTLPSSANDTLSPDDENALLAAFSRFNCEWIERYFRLEAKDIEVLSDPRAHILSRGGFVLVAIQDGCPVGCCALIAHPDDGTWELAKMAVTPSAQGHGTGFLLGRAALAKAREVGAKEVFLEANTLLEASVALYRKLGFKAVADYIPAYERCNLFMIYHP